MTKGWTWFLCTGALVLSFSIARGQSPESIIQQAVDTERLANQNDHSNWVYLDESRKPKEHLFQWVGATQQGDVQRVLERNDQRLSATEQNDGIQRFLHDMRAQKKQMTESKHDTQQVDDFLKLLPSAFLWTQTGATGTDVNLHFEPEPGFRPPTREARVFSAMAGDVVVDKQQHRIRSMSGHLIHDVTFGGGLLGRLKEGSSFSLEQAQVGESVWELTALHVHLQGNALLFKSISLEQDDAHSKFEPVPAGMTLEQAAAMVMKQPDAVPGGQSYLR